MTEQELKAEGLSKFEVMVIRELDQNSQEHAEMKQQLVKIDDKLGVLELDTREIKIKRSMLGSAIAAIVSLAGAIAAYLSTH